MADIQQLARKNISVRRKRPPLPPGGAPPGKVKLKTITKAIIGFKKLPPKEPPPPHLRKNQPLSNEKPPPPKGLPPKKPKRNLPKLNPIVEKDDIFNATSIPVDEPTVGGLSLRRKPNLTISLEEESQFSEGIGSIDPNHFRKNLEPVENVVVHSVDKKNSRTRPVLRISVADDEDYGTLDVPYLSNQTLTPKENDNKENKRKSPMLSIDINAEQDMSLDQNMFSEVKPAQKYSSPLPPLNCSPSNYLNPKQNGIKHDAITIGNFEIGDDGVKYTGSESPKGCFVKASLKEDLITLSVLGAGAGGTVYKALHVPTMKLVAVKSIPVFDAAKREQMIKELRTLHGNMAPIDDNGDSQICPYVVGFYDAYVDYEKGHLAMVEEYMNGGSLQDIIDTGGCSTEAALAQISYRVLKGLLYIHQKKQIHRDIKPSNLLINHNGEVKISDFGIVRELESTQAIASTFVGTLTYMSPERIIGEKYNANCDVWSTGLSIMSCALGFFPLATSGGYWGILHSVNEQPVPELPEDQFSDVFRSFISQCLRKDYHERPNVSELLQHPFVLEVGKEIEKLAHLPPTESEELEPEEGGLEDLEEIYQELKKVKGKVKNLPIGVDGFDVGILDALSLQTGISAQAIKQRLDQALI